MRSSISIQPIIRMAAIGPLASVWLVGLLACGSPQTEFSHGSERAVDRRVEINAAIRAGEHRRGVELYMQWHRARRHYDPIALREMAVSTLWHALSDSRAEVRVQALRVTGRLKVRELERVASARVGDGDAMVAALAVGVVAGKQSLIRGRELLSHTDDRVRAAVIAGLGRRLKRRVRDELIRATADPSLRVRRAAATELGRWATGADRDILHHLLSDREGVVRAAAMRALARDKSKHSLVAAKNALSDSYVGVRLAALDVVAHWPKRHLNILRELARASDSFVALRASIALRKLGEQIPMHTLQLALAHSQWSVRVAALNAIAELLSERDAIAMIDNVVSDNRAEVRLAAARVLLRFGRTAKARAILVAALEDSRDGPRVQAAIDLVRMHDDAGRDALTKLSASRSVETRRQAALGHQYTDNPNLPLVRAMGDSAAEVRVAAAATLLALLRAASR